MDLGIKGRVAVVTGGKSGMGRSTAEHLLREGVYVVLTDKEGAELQATAAELSALGQVRAVEADLSGAKGIEVLAAFANMAFDDKPTILVCAAGITGASGDFLELTDEDWIEALQTDLMAGVRATRAFIPHMRKAGWAASCCSPRRTRCSPISRNCRMPPPKRCSEPREGIVEGLWPGRRTRERGRPGLHCHADDRRPDGEEVER